MKRIIVWVLLFSFAVASSGCLMETLGAAKIVGGTLLGASNDKEDEQQKKDNSSESTTYKKWDYSNQSK